MEDRGQGQDAAPPARGHSAVAGPSTTPSTALAVRADETHALGRLTVEELRAAAGGIRSVHRAISGRAFGAVGPAGRPAEAVHNAVVDGAYDSLRGATSLLGQAAERVLARRAAGDGRTLSTTPGGSSLLAAVNGLIGDALEREGSDLHEPMSVRLGGQVVDLRPESLARAFPAARPRLIVFLHGLMETEHAWRTSGRETYGSRLERELSATALDVRYNSGRHISENGRSLADLLETVVRAWPVEVEEIALVGHSMGGLVSRSACFLAARDKESWVQRVRHVVSLGSPHMGAPLEQGVHLASAALALAPETRPFARFLRRRSGGIRDLRQGSLVDEDWRDCDADSLRATACQEVPLLEGATHCFVTATVTRNPRHPIGRLVGDWLVLQPSGSGRSRSRRIPFRAEDGLHVGGAHHFALLNHPAVYQQLRRWLATPPRRIAAEAEAHALIG